MADLLTSQLALDTEARLLSLTPIECRRQKRIFYQDIQLELIHDVVLGQVSVDQAEVDYCSRMAAKCSHFIIEKSSHRV
jgi:hypothetical protein